MSSLTPFVPAILRGLSETDKATEMLGIVDYWIEEGKHLNAIGHFLAHSDSFDAGRLQSLFKVSVRSDNRAAIFEVIEACVKLYNSDCAANAKSLFLECVGFFGAHDDTRWIRRIWFYVDRTKLFEDLDLGETEVVLNSLVSAPSIDSESEYILAVFAAQEPGAVLDYFDRRLARARELEKEDVAFLDDRFEAVPFSFHKLSGPLSQNPKLILEHAIAWYENDPSLFSFRGGRLVSNIFGIISPDYRDELIAIVKSGIQSHIDMVMSVLRNYEGDVELLEVCRELVLAIDPEDKSRVSEIMIILESTGVVSGEFGFADAYEQKKGEIAHWLEDDDPKVLAFAKKYISSLDRQIADERRRGEARIALRKRDFGED